MAQIPFAWNDPFNLRDQLSDDEKLVQETAAQFASKELLPTVVEAHNQAYFDPGIIQKMGQTGLLGVTGQGYGCAGLGAVAYGLIARELERIDSAYRSAMSVQSSLVIYPVLTYGTSDQKKRYVPDLVSGKKIGCFGLTEPDHGSDPAGMKTHAKSVKGGYILNGNKMWITNSPIADVFIIFAKVDNKQVNGFIVEKGTPGLTTPEMQGKLSLRISLTGEVVLHDVFVSDDQVLPHAKGLSAALGCLNHARFGIAWGVLGAAEFCFHAARDYVLTRKQFGQPLAANQLIQVKLANMQTQIALALQACVCVGRLKEQHKAPHQAISLIKRNSTLIALDIARTARDMLGANGIMDEYHVMRHVMNLETTKTYEGTADIHALILGQAITNIQAFCSKGN